jgi:hypothetical protein
MMCNLLGRVRGGLARGGVRRMRGLGGSLGVIRLDRLKRRRCTGGMRGLKLLLAGLRGDLHITISGSVTMVTSLNLSTDISFVGLGLTSQEKHHSPCQTC